MPFIIIKLLFGLLCYQIVPDLVKVNMSRLMSGSVTGAVHKDFMGEGKLGPMGVEQRVFKGVCYGST